MEQRKHPKPILPISVNTKHFLANSGCEYFVSPKGVRILLGDRCNVNIRHHPKKDAIPQMSDTHPEPPHIPGTMTLKTKLHTHASLCNCMLPSTKTIFWSGPITTDTENPLDTHFHLFAPMNEILDNDFPIIMIKPENHGLTWDTLPRNWQEATNALNNSFNKVRKQPKNPTIPPIAWTGTLRWHQHSKHTDTAFAHLATIDP